EAEDVRCTPQSDIELMAEKEVLDFKSAPRPRLATNMPASWRIGIIVPDDALILPLRANLPDGIFGNDTRISTSSRCDGLKKSQSKRRNKRPIATISGI